MDETKKRINLCKANVVSRINRLKGQIADMENMQIEMDRDLDEKRLKLFGLQANFELLEKICDETELPEVDRD